MYDRDGGTGGGRSWGKSINEQPATILVERIFELTRSSPNRVHVWAIIFESHFSFGSGGGVPAIGWGRGRVAVPVLVAFAFVFEVGLPAFGRVAEIEEKELC